MYYLPDGSVQLELPELIRMNHLIRGQIDLTGFQAWYHTLQPQDQVGLLCQVSAKIVLPRV